RGQSRTVALGLDRRTIRCVPFDMTTSRFFKIGWIIAGLGLVVAAVLFGHGFHLGGMIEHKFDQIVRDPVLSLIHNMILTPAFFIVVAATLTMERIFPAKPNQKIFSISFAQDFIWFFYETILHAAVIATFVALVTSIYYKHFDF